MNLATVDGGNVLADGSFLVDVGRGRVDGSVSNQWASRPDDQRFLDLHELRAQVAQWADESSENIASAIAFSAKAKGGGLTFAINDEPVVPTHYAFGQLANLAKVPADYLRDPGTPASLASACLLNGFANAAASLDGRQVNAYLRRPGADETLLRALTSERYGRIYDRDVADALIRVAGSGTGDDSRWKVPGTIDWGGRFGTKVRYNPEVEITRQNTTLYASDRDLWVFLADDRNPIEVGKLRDGSPDLMFRGFYCWNSEVGSKTFGLACMYIRGVCQNRNLWGVENKREVVVRHTSGGPGRFLEEAAPALELYAESDSGLLVEGVKAAKAAKVAADDEERIAFLTRFGFSQRVAAQMIDRAEEEEGGKPESVWDMAQAITSHARSIPYQDKRIDMERVAQKMLDKVKA